MLYLVFSCFSCLFTCCVLWCIQSFASRKTRKIIEAVTLRSLHFANLRTPSQQLTFLLDAMSEASGRTLHETIMEQCVNVRTELEKFEFNFARTVSMDETVVQSGPVRDYNFKQYWDAMRGSELLNRVRRLIATCLVDSTSASTLKDRSPIFYKRLFKGVDTMVLDPLDIADEAIALLQLIVDTSVAVASGGAQNVIFGQGASQIEEELSTLKALEEYFSRGDLPAITRARGELMTEHDYVVRCDRLVLKIKRSMRIAEGFAREALARRLEAAEKLSIAGLEYMSGRSSKANPLLVVFFGPTGSSKSWILKKFTCDLMRTLGYEKEPIKVINASDPYLSGMSNSDRGILLDDVGSTKSQFCKTNPLEWLMSLCSTIKAPIVSASLEDKGKIKPQPVVVSISTNVGHLGSIEFCTCPSAVLRRADAMVKVLPHKDFITGCNHMVDGSRVGPGEVPCTFTVYDIDINPPNTTIGQELTPDAGFTPRVRRYPPDWWQEEKQGTPMADLDYLDYLQAMVPHLRAKRLRYLALAEDIQHDEAAAICPNHFTTYAYCPCTEPTVVQSGPSDLGDLITRTFLPSVPQPTAPPPSAADSDGSDEFAVHDFADADVEQRSPSWARRSWARLSSFYSAQVSETAWWRTAIFDLLPAERLVQQHPELACAAASSIGWFSSVCLGATLFACGGGFFGVLVVTGTIQTLFGFTGARMARAWVSSRIAGAPLPVIRRHCRNMGYAAIGLSGTLLMLYLLFVMLMRFCRPKAFTAGEQAAVVDDEEKQQPVVSRSPDAAVGPLLLSGSTAQADVAKHPRPVLGADYFDKKRNVVSEGQFLDVRALPLEMRTARHEHLLNQYTKQLARVHVEYASGQTADYNALMVQSDHALEPAHIYFDEHSGEPFEIKRTTYSFFGPDGGAIFDGYRGPNQVAQLAETEIVAVQTGTGGTKRNLINAFSSAVVDPTQASLFVYRNDKYELEVHKVVAKEIFFLAKPIVFSGQAWDLQLPFDTFRGLCGAMLVSNTKIPGIMGFHVRGFKNQPRRSICAGVRRSDLDTALSHLQEVGVLRGLVVHDNSDKLFMRGKEIVLRPLADRSIFRELPEDAAIRYLGTLDVPRNRPHSNTVVAPWSADVEELVGVGREHEPPSTYGSARNVKEKYSGITTQGQFSHAALRLAVADLTQEDIATLLDYEVSDAVRETPLHICLNGGDGLKRVNTSTAVGFPDSGSKMQYLSVVATESDPHNLLMDPEFEARVEVLYDKMCHRERPNLIWKASQKDEPVKLGKLKVRVFEGSCLEGILLGRRALGWMEKCRRALPLEFETSVGLNGLGRDWHEQEEHLNAYNRDWRIEEDFAWYDDSQKYVTMSVAFEPLINIERYFCAAQEHIAASQTYLEEVKRAYVVVNSDLIGKEGSGSSGGWATVDFNNDYHRTIDRAAFYELALEDARAGIEWPSVPHHENPSESLRGYKRTAEDHRAGFMPLVDNLHGRYKDYVRSQFVGDDGKSAVRQEALQFFNMQRKAVVLERAGLTVTTPQKTKIEIDAIPVAESEFLKRGTRWDENLQCYTGPLALKSVFKSLHMTTKARVEMDDVHLAGLIEGVQMELFLHGREIFELYAPRLGELAEKWGATPFLSRFSMTWWGYKQFTNFAVPVRQDSIESHVMSEDDHVQSD